MIDSLAATGRVARVGYVGGVGAAPPSAPRPNLTGDSYFTDGRRALIVLAAATKVDVGKLETGLRRSSG